MRLKGKRVAVLVEDGYQDLEFWGPVITLRAEGAEVKVIGLRADKSCIGKSGLQAYTDVAAANVTADDFDAIIIPGGWAPDKLRRYPVITDLVRAIHEQGKVVGMICHGGLVGISAGIVKGQNATGSRGIKDDLINAGAKWVEQGAFRNGDTVWAQGVKDIPEFCRLLIHAIMGD